MDFSLMKWKYNNIIIIYIYIYESKRNEMIYLPLVLLLIPFSSKQAHPSIEEAWLDQPVMPQCTPICQILAS